MDSITYVNSELLKIGDLCLVLSNKGTPEIQSLFPLGCEVTITQIDLQWKPPFSYLVENKDGVDAWADRQALMKINPPKNLQKDWTLVGLKAPA